MKTLANLGLFYVSFNPIRLLGFLGLFFILISLQSCQKDQDQLPLTSLLGDAKMQTVKGRVLDESGNPVSGATVQAGYGTETTTTDANGVFIIKSIKGFTKLGYIKVNKSGYLPGSRSFSPVKSGSNIIEIMLLQKNLAGTVSSVSGGTVTVEGVKITFPANGFVKNGQTYSGNVKVEANYIDPTSPTLQQEMPGSLLGALDNQAYGLESFGMIGVELTDDNGNKIDLAPGSKATINFPLPASIVSNAPGTIDLWSFDDVSGIWKHEGTAQKINGQYVAEVTHFSWWNVDVPFEFAQVDGVLKDNQNNILPNLKVKATSSSLGGFSESLTNEFGQFSFQVPNSVNIVLKAYLDIPSPCQAFLPPIGTLNLGQIPTNTTIDFIATIPNENNQYFLIIEGQIIDCNNNPISNGVAVFGNQVIYTTGNGYFSYFSCENAVNLNFFCGNISSGLFSTPEMLNYQFGSYNLGQIQACENIINGTGTVTDIDGNSYPTVVIHGKEWMAKNLVTTKFNNGVEIANLVSNSDWASATSPGWCNYNNNPQNNNVYGKLYNFYTIQNGSNNVCPIGWHVPLMEDLIELWATFGNIGGDMKIAGTNFWDSPNTGATNFTGFSGMPGGLRLPNGLFEGKGQNANFFTTESFYKLQYNTSTIDCLTNYINDYNVGMSIRCIKD